MATTLADYDLNTGLDLTDTHLRRLRCYLYPTGRGLTDTLLKHAKHILSYFQVPRTSGMMEGINNKTGRHQRTAYG